MGRDRRGIASEYTPKRRKVDTLGFDELLFERHALSHVYDHRLLVYLVVEFRHKGPPRGWLNGGTKLIDQRDLTDEVGDRRVVVGMSIPLPYDT